mmetsp:Transcript_29011/g.49437  ORF Transcript_29011/g.49437 Transcript_29011/m.49437 type:complete len:200 (-) Transcript_29011:1489-2088(-)
MVLVIVLLLVVVTIIVIILCTILIIHFFILLLPVRSVITVLFGILNIPTRHQITLDIPLRFPNLFLGLVKLLAIRRGHHLLKLFRIVFALHELQDHFLFGRAQPRSGGRLPFPFPSSSRNAILAIDTVAIIHGGGNTTIGTMMMVVASQNIPHLFHTSLQLLPLGILQSLQLFLLGASFGGLAFLSGLSFALAGFVLAT